MGTWDFFLIFSFLICKLTGLDLTAKISSIHCKLGLRSFKIGFVTEFWVHTTIGKGHILNSLDSFKFTKMYFMIWHRVHLGEFPISTWKDAISAFTGWRVLWMLKRACWLIELFTISYIQIFVNYWESKWCPKKIYHSNCNFFDKVDFSAVTFDSRILKLCYYIYP